MRKIEAVIFDWAGTTVDYGSFAPVQAFIESFKTFGITPTLDEVREPMGMLKWDHIHTMMKMSRITEEWVKIYGHMWTKEEVDALYEKSEQAIFKILPQFSQPKPFVLETIEALKNRGIKIGSTTGYTDEMMAYVVPAAKAAGYAPDAWFTPNSVNNIGRPYPFMVYRNMEALKVTGVNAVIKVGDTVADIKEGLNAGLTTVGIIEGSSIMGLTQAEYEALSEAEKEIHIDRVKKVYQEAGADYMILNMSDLLGVIEDLEG